METHSQPRTRKRQRPRASDGAGGGGGGNTAIPGPVAPGWGGPQVAAHPSQIAHPQAVRAHGGDTVPSLPPTFPSQQLDSRSHQVQVQQQQQQQQQQVADADGLMNGYNAAAQHNQYPEPPPSLAQATQGPQGPDAAGLTNLQIPHQQLQQLQQQHQQQQQQHHPQLQQQQHPQPQQQPQPQQPQQQQQQQQRPSVATTNKTDRAIFQQYAANNSHSGNETSPTSAVNTTAAPPYNNLSVWSIAAPAPPPPAMPPPSPAAGGTPGLAPPPEGIYRNFDDLLASVQKVAKDQGYGVVKLRASNYREGKPTRYDLVCDRGGVKYSSTAKKRNPSTRKVDCPWRAKAVCEVNLGNQWRFAVQEGRHNHEPRIPAAVPGQENTPVAQSIRSITNKIDRMSHDMNQGFNRLESAFSSRLETMEKRIDALEGRGPTMMGGTGVPTANMGGGSMGNNPMANGGMGSGTIVDSRLNSMEARMAAIEQQRNDMNGMPMMDDDSTRLSSMMVT
ncbi:hypothetical protein B0T19DRAFT_449281 [Cercophora scortea]|uniref:Uncharacterized protein n=1 Tax=Cercophora scortea TaxID=314031 RepID=A0AAE0J014_9PEZI|nr:hypothetical protein B0T19DRAFT_449281 [Cercophora scortea]